NRTARLHSMITPAKFLKLSRKRQVYWLIKILSELEQLPQEERICRLDKFYTDYLGHLVANELRLGRALQRQWYRWKTSLKPDSKHAERKELEYLFRQLCSEEPCDWDEEPLPSEGQPNRESPYLGLYLDRVRSPFNIGSIFRSAAAFGVQEIWLHSHCPDLQHPRARRAAMGSIDKLLSKRSDQPGQEHLPWWALETQDVARRYQQNVTWLNQAAFPPTGGLLLIGTEEHGLRDELLAYCASPANRGGGIVSIPLSGIKQSLNVGVATAIALQRWTEVIHFEPSFRPEKSWKRQE
ncbi:MAG: TrmH family RNA methyltransferase, partial [Spirochaetota bacterium]